MITKNVLDDIRFRCDIVDVIDSYITLPRKTGAIKTLCPFHKEKTPSFHVNAQRQMFHCFGCGAGGDVFKFVMMFEQVDFPMAIKILADKSGVPVEFEKGGQPSGERELLLAVHEKLAADYHKMLMKSPDAQPARDYLAQRKLTGDIVDSFLIGYAPEKRDSLMEWAKRNNFSPSTLELAGLLAQRNDGPSAGSYYDRFRGRIMFPIRNEQGRVVGFSGRTLIKDAKIAKYVNSPETPLFRKSHILYALDRARREIAEKREALVCEGQIDVIRCHQAGFTNAVAAQGTAFTEDHARILHRYADSVILVFDSDDAGQNAALRSTQIFMRAGLAVRIASLPKGDDPDSIILREGAPSFQRILQQAVPAIDYQINYLVAHEDIRSEAGLMRVSRAVLATISQAPNAIQRDVLLQNAARRLNISAAALQSELRPILRKMDESAAKSAAPIISTGTAEHSRFDMPLAEHIGASPDLVDLIQAYLPLTMISDPLCRRFIEAAIHARKEREELMSVLSQMDDDTRELSTFAAKVLSAPLKTGRESSHRDAVESLILGLWRAELQRRCRDVEQRSMDTTIESDKDSLNIQAQQLTTDIKKLQRWVTGETILHLYADVHP
jgi:DNA primase